jgi:cytoskeletal protein RodZ
MYESPPPDKRPTSRFVLIMGYMLVLCLVWSGLFGLLWWLFGGVE